MARLGPDSHVRITPEIPSASDVLTPILQSTRIFAPNGSVGEFINSIDPQPTFAPVGEPSLEWVAPIEDDFSVDREFLKPPTLYLDKIRANEPDRSYICVGGILVRYKATHNGPVIGLRLCVHVCNVEFNMVMA